MGWKNKAYSYIELSKDLKGSRDELAREYAELERKLKIAKESCSEAWKKYHEEVDRNRKEKGLKYFEILRIGQASMCDAIRIIATGYEMTGGAYCFYDVDGNVVYRIEKPQTISIAQVEQWSEW